jgi:hypothetical protein
MPYYQTITYASAATETSIGLDPSIAPFNATVVCTLLGGATASYKLQFTLKEYGALDTDSSANWIDSQDIPSGTTTNAYASFLTPVSRVRLVIASLSGGALQIEVRQGLSTN